MDRRFIKAFTKPGETVLLGYRMRPFSLKHRMALHAIGSPFVLPDKPLSVLDLFMAVKICAEKSVRGLTFMDVFRMSAIKANPRKMAEHVNAFHEYSNVSHWPKFWNQGKKQGGSARSVPWVLQVISNLIANGWDEEAAWSLPESQAIWYHTAISIRNGNEVALLNEDDDEIMANFKKLAEEAKARPRVRRHNKAKL
jgi:hypothetical protein